MSLVCISYNISRTFKFSSNVILSVIKFLKAQLYPLIPQADTEESL